MSKCEVYRFDSITKQRKLFKMWHIQNNFFFPVVDFCELQSLTGGLCDQLGGHDGSVATDDHDGGRAAAGQCHWWRLGQDFTGLNLLSDYLHSCKNQNQVSLSKNFMSEDNQSCYISLYVRMLHWACLVYDHICWGRKSPKTHRTLLT